MQAKDLLKYRNKIIDAFKDGAFISKHLKESDDAAYDYVLTDVNKFIEKIKLMEEKINVSLFEEFFIKNIKTRDEEKEIVEDIKNRISDLKDKIKKNEWKRKKDKIVDEALKIIRKVLGYDEEAQKLFHRASKVDKRKSKPKTEESIPKRVKLRNERIAEIKKEEKNIKNDLLKQHFINYQKPIDMYKKLNETKGKINEDQVDLTKEILGKIKKIIKNVLKDKSFIF